MGIVSGISTEWLFVHCFQVELEFGNVGFCGGRKTGVPREKPSEHGREPSSAVKTPETDTVGFGVTLYWLHGISDVNKMET